MAELEQKSTYTLQEVGEKPISFILTYSSSYIVNSDNSGNIIVYAEHKGDPVTYNDAYSEKYNDLYVGDEHIAGGFGFRNISERAFAYDAIWTRLPDIENRLDDINQSPSESTDQNSLIIDSTYSYITTEYGLYQLDYDSLSNKLSIKCDHKDYILYSDVVVDDKNIENNSKIYNITNGFTLSYLTFTVSSNSNIDGIFFTYSTLNTNDIKTSPYIIQNLYGSKNNLYNLEDNDHEFIESHCIYSLVDPNVKPNVKEEKWKLYFNEDFNSSYIENLANKSCKLWLNIKIENKIISYAFLTIRCVKPIYYLSSKEIPTSLDEFKQKIDYDDECILSFDHETENTYDYVIIPEEFNNVKFLFPQTNVYAEWKKIQFTFSKNTYNYQSPNKYTGKIDWNLILKSKEE